MRRILMAVIAVSAMVGCGGPMGEPMPGPGDAAIQQESLKKTTSGTDSNTNTGIVPPSARKTTGTTTTTSTALRSTADASMSASCASWSTSFPIFTTSAVYFAFDIKATSGHHTEKLYLYDERGMLYQEIQVAFAAGVTPYTNEQAGEALGGGVYRVWASLPVAGTAIDTGMMSGTWSGQAYLDSATKASATESFDLT